MTTPTPIPLSKTELDELVELLQVRNHKDRLEHIEHYLEAFPTCHRAIYRRAHLLSEVRRFAEADAVIKPIDSDFVRGKFTNCTTSKKCRLCPGGAWWKLGWNVRGNIAGGVGDNKGALGYYRSTHADAGNSTTKYNIVATLVDLELVDEARDAYYNLTKGPHRGVTQGDKAYLTSRIYDGLFTACESVGQFRTSDTTTIPRFLVSRAARQALPHDEGDAPTYWPPGDPIAGVWLAERSPPKRWIRNVTSSSPIHQRCARAGLKGLSWKGLRACLLAYCDTDDAVMDADDPKYLNDLTVLPLYQQGLILALRRATMKPMLENDAEVMRKIPRWLVHIHLKGDHCADLAVTWMIDGERARKRSSSSSSGIPTVQETVVAHFAGLFESRQEDGDLTLVAGDDESEEKVHLGAVLCHCPFLRTAIRFGGTETTEIKEQRRLTIQGIDGGQLRSLLDWIYLRNGRTGKGTLLLPDSMTSSHMLRLLPLATKWAAGKPSAWVSYLKDALVARLNSLLTTDDNDNFKILLLEEGWRLHKVPNVSKWVLREFGTSVPDRAMLLGLITTSYITKLQAELKQFAGVWEDNRELKEVLQGGVATPSEDEDAPDGQLDVKIKVTQEFAEKYQLLQ